MLLASRLTDHRELIIDRAYGMHKRVKRACEGHRRIIRQKNNSRRVVAAAAAAAVAASAATWRNKFAGHSREIFSRAQPKQTYRIKRNG